MLSASSGRLAVVSIMLQPQLEEPQPPLAPRPRTAGTARCFPGDVIDPQVVAGIGPGRHTARAPGVDFAGGGCRYQAGDLLQRLAMVGVLVAHHGNGLAHEVVLPARHGEQHGLFLVRHTAPAHGFERVGRLRKFRCCGARPPRGAPCGSARSWARCNVVVARDDVVDQLDGVPAGQGVLALQRQLVHHGPQVQAFVAGGLAQAHPAAAAEIELEAPERRSAVAPGNRIGDLRWVMAWLGSMGRLLRQRWRSWWSFVRKILFDLHIILF